MPFKIITEELQPSQKTQYRLSRNDQPLTNQDFLLGLQHDPEFRLAYNQLLADADYSAFFWEHPRFTLENLAEPYTFVLVNSKSLKGITANPDPFKQYFTLQEPIVEFSSLRGDAELVVPNAVHDEGPYPSIAEFVRNAPVASIHTFWIAVGRLTQKTLDSRAVFLNTSGLGVSWLHVRLDSGPKYYTHQPFKK